MFTEWLNYFTDNEFVVASTSNGISDKLMRRRSSNIEFLVDENNFSFNDGYIENVELQNGNPDYLKENYLTENAEIVRQLLSPTINENIDYETNKVAFCEN